MQQLIEPIRRALESAGWVVAVDSGSLKALRDDIKAAWWFGTRRVRSSLHCIFDEKNKALDYCEFVTEVATGLPPPSFSVRRWKQSGLTVEIQRKDHSLGGGGNLHYGTVRALLETHCRTQGWTLNKRVIL